MLVFCIVFGLSMDYEVFLLSRVHEAWLDTRDAHRSVAIGIGATARVITTAAAIMIVVFTSFVLDPDPTVKMLATGDPAEHRGGGRAAPVRPGGSVVPQAGLLHQRQDVLAEVLSRRRSGRLRGGRRRGRWSGGAWR